MNVEMKSLAKQLRKYFVMGSQDCQNRSPEEILTEAAEAGITTFQYREKGEYSLTGEKQIELGKRLREICREYDILFIVNDDVDLIEPLDADGVHVGQKDTPVEKIREQYPNKIIGLSISNQTELNNSPIELIDYVGAGPIYKTATKPGKIPVGLEWIQTLRKKHPKLPMVGIGGINPDNASLIVKAGANGVAVVSTITKAKNIMDTVKKL